MLFEIFPDEADCKPRTIKGRDDRPDRVVYDQKVFWKKGRQVIELTVTHDEVTAAYPVGTYTIDEESFEFENNYGRGQLKLNPYRFKLKPLSTKAS